MNARGDAWRLVAVTAAALCLAYALHVYSGVLADRRALAALCAAIVCTAAAVVLRDVPLPDRLAARAWPVLAGAGVLYGAYGLINGLPAPGGVHDSLPVQLGLGVAAALALTVLLHRPPLGRLHVPLLLVTYFVVGVSIVKAAGVPSIDVVRFHEAGLGALLAGKSPYATTIANLYGSGAAHFYDASLVGNGRVHVGYPYPPLNLFLALPGYLAGDYRYALVAAVVVAAGFLAYAQGGYLTQNPAEAGSHGATGPPHTWDPPSGGFGRGARAGAALLLFCPRTLFVCEQGWTEPFVAMTLAGVVFCAVRGHRALPWALAAFLATKQYSVLALPLVGLLVPGGWTRAARVVVIAAAVACAVSLPFALGDAKGFVDSVLLFQLRQPFRPESLSLLAKVPGSETLGSGLGLAAALVAIGVSLGRAPRGTAGFSVSLALASVLFFAFAKQAFWNYYFFVFGTLASAVSVFEANLYRSSAGATRPSRAGNDDGDEVEAPVGSGNSATVKSPTR